MKRILKYHSLLLALLVCLSWGKSQSFASAIELYTKLSSSATVLPMHSKHEASNEQCIIQTTRTGSQQRNADVPFFETEEENEKLENDNHFVLDFFANPLENLKYNAASTSAFYKRLSTHTTSYSYLMLQVFRI